MLCSIRSIIYFIQVMPFPHIDVTNLVGTSCGEHVEKFVYSSSESCRVGRESVLHRRVELSNTIRFQHLLGILFRMCQ